ncbi:WD40 repeat domain-containing protein [Gloeobacter violaceus]|uniref:WD-repeat protein n=1 Tax=Gloeobacter violaceus (strain ATCC 29082 / PCC 7421) TaxID=251221 RepID=Q7NCT8_GLOVI|nr:NB-ARC domain-containing protein [Gloeobacter violaceus]BAC90829.1 WD-repeat protein [Gloeobacter violaceus PCC 7421]
MHFEDALEVADAAVFYGRTDELATLERWLAREHCRLIAVVGIGGVGKTALSIRLARRVQPHFERVLWRSLRNAPPLSDLLAELIELIAGSPQTSLPVTVEGRTTQLLAQLRRCRCLLMLDNGESLLGGGERPGSYLQGYEGYGELFRRVGESVHRSCLLITSREKPDEVAVLEGEMLPVRSMRLGGLQQGEGERILEVWGLRGTDGQRRQLVERYRGNPLALKIMGATIQELFSGDIGAFVAQDAVVFDGLRSLLDQQFDRLTAFEKQVMYWLAIDREGTEVAQLQADIVPSVTAPRLLQTLESLLKRSLIERSSAGFTQQPVVMEYTSERIIQQVCREIVQQEAVLLKSHALLKAQSKDYIKETQTRLIVGPLLDRLLNHLKSKQHIETRIACLLADQREQTPLEPGYVGGNLINLLCALGTDLSDWDFSGLCVWQADLQRAPLRRTSFARADLRGSVFGQTFAGILLVAFNPEGTVLAIGDDSGEIRLLRAADGQQQARCTGHTDALCAMAFHPEGNLLASGSEDLSVKLWAAGSGQCLATLTGHTGWVYAVAFAPDGRTLASGSVDGTVRLWDVGTGLCLKILCEPGGQFWSVAFAPDGQTLATAGHGHAIKLWQVSSGACALSLEGHTAQVRSVAFSPDGRTLASAGVDGTVRLWDVPLGACLMVLEGHTSRVRTVAFSPGGHLLASGGHDQTVRLWEVRSGRCLRVLPGHTGQVWSLAFHPNGRTLASGSMDQTVRLWEVDSGRSLKTFQGNSGWIWSVAFHPGGHLLASGSMDRLVRLWDTRTGQCLKTLAGHGCWVWSLAFHPGGEILASGSFDQTVKLWEVDTGRCIQSLAGHTNWIRAVAFSPDGAQIASAGVDQTIRLWAWPAGNCTAVLTGHTGWVRCVAFGPDGRQLASGSLDRTIKIWDAATGECVATLGGHRGQICAVAFSPDGSLLASAAEDHLVKLWNLATGECVATLAGHCGPVWSVAFAPDGLHLASCGHDQVVRFWDAGSGALTATLRGHSDQVWSVAYDPRGETLASGSQDKTIRLWNPATGECLKILQAERLYEGMNIAGAVGLTESQMATLRALGAVGT